MNVTLGCFGTDTNGALPEHPKRASLAPTNEETPRAIVVHMKEKFCKGNIFISHFLTGPDRRYKRGHCGILLKNCRVASSPLATQMAPLHSDGIIAHSTRMSHIRNSIRPTFYLIRMSHSRNSVRPTSHFLWISHSRNSIRPTFHLLRLFHIRRLSPDGRGEHFSFPGQTCPDPLVALTRRTSATDNSDSPDSLARQTLAIHRIHFRPQSKSKLRQC